MDNPIKPTTKAILVTNIFTGHLPLLRAKKYAKKEANRIKKSVSLPDDFVLYFRLVQGSTAPTKAFEVIRLDGKEDDKEKPLFAKEWINDKKKAIDCKDWQDVQDNFWLPIDEGKNNLINVRISDDEKEEMIEKSEELGFKNLSDYLRFVGLNAELKVEVVPPHINNNDTH